MELVEDDEKKVTKTRSLDSVLHSKPGPHVLHHTSYNPLTWMRTWMFPEPKLRVNFTDFIQFVEPGDILLFAADNFFAWMQDFWTGSPYSHIGLPFFYNPMLWRKQVRLREEQVAAGLVQEDAPFPVPSASECKVLMLAESTSKSGLTDYSTGTDKEGVMCVIAAQRFVQYMIKWGYRIVWRRLNPSHRDISEEERVRRTQAVLRVLYRKRNFGFDAHAADLMNAAIPEVHVFPWFYIKGDFTHEGEAFCSQLTSEILKEMNVLRTGPYSKRTNDYCPGDFSEQVENLDTATYKVEHSENEIYHHYGPEILVDINCVDF